MEDFDGKDNVQEFFYQLENQFSLERNQKLEKVKKEIKDLYDQSKKGWEKYLHPSGSGVIEYLRDITQINLSHINF